MRKYILGSMLSVLFLSGTLLADIGHGTHTAGTIGAVGNNGTTLGGGGRDLLLGGAGGDYLEAARLLLVAGVQYLVYVR